MSIHRVGPGEYAWQVPDGWQQGRGAWGGLIIGALARAVAETEPDASRTLRTVSLQIMAPALVGEHRIRVEAARRGSAMSTWAVGLVDGDAAPIASMVAITGSPRAEDAADQGDWGIVRPPTAPPAESVDRMRGGPPFPVFTAHLDMRPVAGLPLSGGPAESVGWVGYGDGAAYTAASLLALVDAWWPASLMRLQAMPRVASVNVTANLMVDPATLSAGEPLLQHSFLTSAAGGFTSEHRRLWTPGGRLVVDNLQTIVIGS